MAKVTEYPRITKMKDNDILLVDGPDGTRTILKSNAAKDLGGDIIAVTKSGSKDKVTLNLTDSPVDLATEKDLDDVANALLPIGTASGNPAIVTDAKNGVAFRKLKTGIAFVQAGSGDPSPDNVREISGWTGASIRVSPTDGPTGGQTYSITFPTEAGTVYGGTLDVTDGTLTVIYGSQQLAAADIYSYGTTTGGVSYVRFLAPLNAAESGSIYSDRYTGYRNTNNRASGDIAMLANGAVYLYDNRFTDRATAEQILTEEKPLLVYPLAEPVAYQLTTAQIVALAGYNAVFADCGPVELSYIKDTKIQDMIAEESDSTASRAFTNGEYVIVEDKLYKVTVDISAGTELVPGTNIEETTVGEELNGLNEMEGDDSELKTPLEEGMNITILDYNNTGYIRTDSTTLNIATPVPDATYSCSVIEASPGDVFTITATAGNAARPWAFINANNERLTYASAESSYDESIIAPANTEKLVVNAKIAGKRSIVKGTYSIIDKHKVQLRLSESLSSISSIVNSFLSDDNIDIVELSSGNYKVYTTINIPDGKTLILQGDYKNSAIKPTKLTPLQNNTTILTLGTKSKLIGGWIDLSTYANTTAIKLDCHKDAVEFSSVARTKITGGRETENNHVFSQTGVLIECDYASGETVTTHGYMQFCKFDIDIRSLGAGYIFHRQSSSGDPATGVWLTNNDIDGFIYRCTRPIWYDLSDGQYANNNSKINADLQAGALYVSEGETAYPGVNIFGKSIVISGRFWDFTDGRQNPAVYFEESSSGCFVLHQSTSIGSWQFTNGKLTTNVTANELITLSGYKNLNLSRYSALIENFTNASYRVGDTLYIKVQFKIDEGKTIEAGTNLIEILDEDALNMSYVMPIYNLGTGELKGTLQIYRSSTRTFIKNLTALTYEDSNYLDGQCVALSNRINSYSL